MRSTIRTSLQPGGVEKDGLVVSEEEIVDILSQPDAFELLVDELPASAIKNGLIVWGRGQGQYPPLSPRANESRHVPGLALHPRQDP